MGTFHLDVDSSAMGPSTNAIGRKKLVPVLSCEAKCPHKYSDDNELCLDVDCSDCQGAQDLENNRCLAGILQILSSEAKPDTLILRRHIHRRYRGPCLSTLMNVASDLASMNRALSMKPVLSDKECQTCEASAPKLLGRIRRELLEDPSSFLEGTAVIMNRVSEDLAVIDCERVSACVARAFSSWRTRGG